MLRLAVLVETTTEQRIETETSIVIVWLFCMSHMCS